jgi:hypothetical protein
MCLRFVFLVITSVVSWPRLSRREETWKTAEILIMRHQLAVLQRRQPHRPNLSWADRALLAILHGVIPNAAAAGCGCWSPRTRSCAGTATSSAAAGRPGPCAARPAGHPQEHQGTGAPAGPREPRMGLPQDRRRAGRPGSEDSGIDGVGDSEESRNRPRAALARAFLVAVPALPGRSDPGVRLLHGRPARRHPGLCPGRGGARHQAHPHPRSQPASHREMDRPAGPQP